MSDVRRINKVVRVGETDDGHAYARIEFDGRRLSITGVIGPKANGDCRGSAGQWIMTLREYHQHGHMGLSDINPAPGWTAEDMRTFFDIWHNWHMNDMRAGCEHQRLAGLAEGVCGECGYEWGSAWLFEPVPGEVLSFLSALPDTDLQPAWV